MANTLKRGYPFPVPGVTPDVPYWNQQLAEKIDTDVDQLFGVQSAQGRGALARATSASDVASIVGTEKFIIAIASVTLKKGRTYRITLKFNYYADAADHAAAVIVKRSSTDPALIGTTTGTVIDNSIYWTHPTRASVGASGLLLAFYTPAQDETVRLLITTYRVVGAGNITFSAETNSPRTLYIEDSGIF